MKQRWPGGYVHPQANGQPLFIIEKKIRGRRYHVSTRAHSLRAAMAQLERFEANPAEYQPEGEAPAALLLTVELVQEFHAHQEAKGNSRRYVRATTKLLADWMEALRGKDLRRLDLRADILPALEREGRAHRIIALKSFFGWLRREKHLLRLAEDATADLKVPQASPEKHRRRKAVAWARVQACFRHLAPRYRDVLQLMAATGWHVTELERFARDDASEVVEGRGKVLAVLVTRHKSGALTRTPLTKREHLEAARRIRRRRSVPRYLNAHVRAACRKAKVEPFTLGVMRHSVATWAIELGATAEQTAEYLGHASKSTTLRFYADVAVPTVAVPTRALR